MGAARREALPPAVESGGGGAHAYWLLDKPLPATDQDQPAGLRAEPIERAHARIIHRLGVDQHGRPNVADPACRDRSRLMRLSGSVNGKTGRPARILEADFQLAPYAIEQLVGDLPDPTPAASTQRHRRAESSTGTRTSGSARPSTSSSSPGSRCPAAGSCPCPAPRPPRPAPVLLGRNATQRPGLELPRRQLWARAGAIYDLASVLLGGPWGRELRGEQFKRARAYVADVFGELA